MSEPLEDGRASQPPPAERSQRKRSWYLVLALIFAWIYGAGAASEGCAHIELYRTGASEVVGPVVEQARTIDAEATDTVIRAHDEVVHAAKNRLFPLAAASFLLGSVMWFLAAGAMAGRPGARRVLLQVVFVYTIVLGVAYMLTPDVRKSQLAVQVKLTELLHEPKDPQEKEIFRAVQAHAWLLPPFFAFLKVMGCGLVVVALTRKRSREFFEAPRPRWGT